MEKLSTLLREYQTQLGILILEYYKTLVSEKQSDCKYFSLAIFKAGSCGHDERIVRRSHILSADQSAYICLDSINKCCSSKALFLGNYRNRHKLRDWFREMACAGETVNNETECPLETSIKHPDNKLKRKQKVIVKRRYL